LTRGWQRLSQFSRGVRRKTLVITCLSHFSAWQNYGEGHLGVTEKHFRDNAVIGHGHHAFMRGKSCLTDLISFYDRVTCLVDQERQVDVDCLDFSNVFDTVSHSITLDKMSSIQLDKSIVLR